MIVASTALAWKKIWMASAAAAAGSAWSVLDCNPQLYWQEKWNSSQHPASPYDGTTIWIIGASSGIGSEMALQLARESHCRRLVLSSRGQDRLEQVAQQCHEQRQGQQQQQQLQQQDQDSDSPLPPPLECVCLPLDVTGNLEHLQSVIDQVHQLTGIIDTPTKESSSSSSSPNVAEDGTTVGLDMVVLNAGAGQLSPALETDPATTKTVMDTNALWPMILVPLLLKPFQQSPKNINSDNDGVDDSSQGTITKQHQGTSPLSPPPPPPPKLLVTNSIAALVPVPLSASYAAAKAALRQYFLSLVSERPDLQIHLVYPGPVDTEFHSNHLNGNRKNNEEGQYEAAESSNASTDHRTKSSSSPLKMSVQRCARLMLASAAASNSGGIVTESWIAQQPTLTALYANHLLPSWMMRPLFRKIGTRRVQLWRQGLDLYDPQSWTNPTNNNDDKK